MLPKLNDLGQAQHGLAVEKRAGKAADKALYRIRGTVMLPSGDDVEVQTVKQLPL